MLGLLGQCYVIKGNTVDRCARICLLSLSDAHSPTVAPDSFKFAALDALKISDRPIEFLLDREEPPTSHYQAAGRTPPCTSCT